MVIDQASDFSTTLNLTDTNGDPLNLNGYTALASMRKWYTSNTFVSFVTSVNVNTGTITLTLSGNTTSNLYPGRYVYDVEIYNGTTTTRVVEGEVFLTPAVTANTIMSNWSYNWANTWDNNP